MLKRMVGERRIEIAKAAIRSDLRTGVTAAKVHFRLFSA